MDFVFYVSCLSTSHILPPFCSFIDKYTYLCNLLLWHENEKRKSCSFFKIKAWMGDHNLAMWKWGFTLNITLVARYLASYIASCQKENKIIILTYFLLIFSVSPILNWLNLRTTGLVTFFHRAREYIQCSWFYLN